jgi:hypothetical protein
MLSLLTEILRRCVKPNACLVHMHDAGGAFQPVTFTRPKPCYEDFIFA